MANHSAQYFLSINPDENKKFYLKGLEDKFIIDAVIIEHNHLWFIFFSENDTHNSLLNIWFSKSPFGQFKPHQENPVIISPQVARMAGGILKTNEGLL